MCRENLNCLLTEKCTNEIKIRADERAKVLDEVRNALLEKADYMETEEGFYGKVVTEKEIEEVIENLKEQTGEGRKVD